MANSYCLDGTIIELDWWQAGSCLGITEISYSSRIKAHCIWNALTFHIQGKEGNEWLRNYLEEVLVPTSVLGSFPIACTWERGNPSREHFQCSISPFLSPVLPPISLSSFSFTWSPHIRCDWDLSLCQNSLGSTGPADILKRPLIAFVKQNLWE